MERVGIKLASGAVQDTKEGRARRFPAPRNARIDAVNHVAFNAHRRSNHVSKSGFHVRKSGFHVSKSVIHVAGHT